MIKNKELFPKLYTIETIKLEGTHLNIFKKVVELLAPVKTSLTV